MSKRMSLLIDPNIHKPTTLILHNPDNFVPQVDFLQKMSRIEHIPFLEFTLHHLIYQFYVIYLSDVVFLLV